MTQTAIKPATAEGEGERGRAFKNPSPFHTSYCSWDCGDKHEQPPTPHTATPWRVTCAGYIAKASGGFVPIESPYKELAPADEEVAQRNTALIVQAVNSHEALVAALAALVAADNCNYDRDTMRSEGLFDQARAALALAEGK